MTPMLVCLAVLAIGGYVALVRWHMSQPPGAEVYNAVVARFLPENGVVTLWLTLYKKDIRQVLKPEQRVHERFHIFEQWCRWPQTFLFRILIDYALRGYNGSVYENEARRAAGQPERAMTSGLLYWWRRVVG